VYRVLVVLILLAGTAAAQTTMSGSATASGSTVLQNFASVTPPVITSFSAAPTSVASGTSAALSWSVTGATTITLVNTTPAGTLCNPCASPSGTISTGNLSTLGSYTLSATNANGTVQQSITVPVIPIPTATLTSCSPSTMNSNALVTVTCSGTTTNASTCAASKSPGGAIAISPCASFTFTDNPAVTTIYQATGTGNGLTVNSNTQTVTVVPIAPSADDNSECNTNGFSVFYNNTAGTVAGVPAWTAALDGFSELFRRCNYTALSQTPASNSGSPTVIACTGNVATDTTAYQNALNAASCGDVIESASGCTLNHITLPNKRCPVSNWIWAASGGPGKGIHDPNFPAEGSIVSYVQTTHTTPTGYPSYAGPALSTPLTKILANTTNTPAIQTTTVSTWPAVGHDTEDWSLNSTYTSGTPGPNLPAVSAWRIMGFEITPAAATQITGPLVDLTSADYVVLDRNVIHGSDCVAANFAGVCTTGVGVTVQGTHLSVINSVLYDLGCPQGTGSGICSEGHAILGGLGNSWQGSIKIVNNLIAADGTNFFFGGGAAGNLTNTGSPNGVQGPTGTGWNLYGILPTDVELRRNYLFKPLTWFMPKAWAGFAHPGVKNLGEFKSCDRCLAEGNLAENNWTGQYDQTGNIHLWSPKSQSSKLSAGTKVVTMSKVDDGLGGRVFAYCSNCTASGGGAGTGNFTCEEDKTQANPATCPGIQTFTGLAGSYIKTCPVGEHQAACRLTIGGTNYHVKAYNPVTPFPAGLPATDLIELWADEITTGFAGNTGTLPFVSTPVTYTICKRGLNPFAQVRNVTNRYDLDRHVMSGFELQSALSDCGDEALGIHNISMHDIVAVDQDVTFWNNTVSSGCCNTGWGVRVVSNASTTASVPDHIFIAHNTFALRNWNGNYTGGILWYDQSYDAGTAISNAEYMPFITIRDNIGPAPFSVTAGKGVGSKFLCNTLGGCAGGPVSQGVAIYGSAAHNGTASTANIQRNLMMQNIAPLGFNDLPDMNKGTNTVETCSTFVGVVTTGQAAACDRIASAAGYGDVLTSYSSAFPYMPTELQAGTVNMAVQSPYMGAASDGGNLGADTVTTLGKVAGIYANPNLLTLALITSLPAITHGVAITPVALCSGQSTSAPFEGCGASPFKQWTLVAGTVPTGLSLSLTTGVLSGTATSAGAYSFTVSTVDAARRSVLNKVYSGSVL
jgi:hypothetical protein